MRVAVVVAAMLFCMAGCSRNSTNSIGMELIEIPAGTFTMGSYEDEKDRHEDEVQVRVTLTQPFGLGKYEVTQGQWKSVMGTEPWRKRQTNTIKGENVSATYVNYDDAVDFCEKLTELERKSRTLKAGEEYRLPTEAEWEYACRAGTTTAFSFGDDEKQLGEYAWWGGFNLETLKKGELKAGAGNAAREQYAHKVGTKKPNPWGLHDMHGNVWERCSQKRDGIGLDGPGVRGGGWWFESGYCRSANRHTGFVPMERQEYLGFRVARSQSAQ